MKTISISTQQSCHFSKKISWAFQSINHWHSVTAQPTHQPCLCVTGCWPLNLQGNMGAKTVLQRKWPVLRKKAFQCDQPYTLGSRSLGPGFVSAGSWPGLSALTLLDASTIAAWQVQQQPDCRLLLSVRSKSFALNNFHKSSHTCMCDLINRPKCYHY